MIAEDAGHEPDEAGAQPAEKRRGRRWRALAGWKKALIVLGVLALVTAGGVTGGGFYLYQRYENRVARADLLPEPSTGAEAEQRAENWKSGPLNILLLGSDSRAGEPGGQSPIGERADTIMLVHIARSRDRATIISIPRDTYVDIPASGSWKGGKNKINAAFAYGGAKLTAATVGKLTGVRLDGAMVANFQSIHTLVDAVEGVNVCVPYEVRSTFSSKVWKEGCHDMDGDEAEEFMRQRYQVPGGDFGRMHNQQAVAKAVIAKVSANDLLQDPMKLDNLLITAAAAVTVDRSLSLPDLALAVRDIRPAAIGTATVPYATANLRTDAGVAVQLDDELAAEMFQAIRDDTVDRWLADNPQGVPGS